MRNILIYSIVLFVSINSSAQVRVDSNKINQDDVRTIQRKFDQISKEVDTIKSQIAGVKNAFNGDEENCINCRINSWQWLLIFSPLWMFAIAWLILSKKLKGYVLRDALKETAFRKRMIPNPEYSVEKILSLSGNAILTAHLTSLVPPTIEITDPGENGKDSSSRFIALVTSAIAWVIALCLSCFYLYEYVVSGAAPKLDGLSSVLITLGIGVVPYSFNRVSRASNS